ncbi:hypothetical protein Mapa_002670 [Marchantia paleacea]|nr:hypothetical protein Mapa_002670 [Marchantia paleacea]
MSLLDNHCKTVTNLHDLASIFILRALVPPAGAYNHGNRSSSKPASVACESSPGSQCMERQMTTSTDACPPTLVNCTQMEKEIAHASPEVKRFLAILGCMCAARASGTIPGSSVRYVRKVLKGRSSETYRNRRLSGR